MAADQRPWALVLGCIDSRVPPEVVFDTGLGDIFVVRTAGQAVDRAVLGSIDLAVSSFETPLVVVLGHSRCGAVRAVEDAVRTGAGGAAPSLVEAIRPAIEQARTTRDDPVLVNVRLGVDTLERSVGDGARVVGACYDLDTGAVSVLES